MRETLSAPAISYRAWKVLTCDLTARSQPEAAKGEALHRSRLPKAGITALTHGEGAALLRRLGVGGIEEECAGASRRLHGHPIALRLFARAVEVQAEGETGRRIELAFTAAGLREQDDLERKLKHLLAFYERNLPAAEAGLLSLLALFTTPVPPKTLARLCAGLRRADLPTSDIETIGR